MVRFSVTTLVVTVLAGVLFPACSHDSPVASSPVSPAVSCTYTVSGTREAFGPTGGSGSVTVAGLPAGCGGAWFATSSADWLAVTLDLLQSGGGRVTYRVAANEGAERTGTLTVAGRAVVITQQSPGGRAFNYTGDVQTWIVPAGVTVVDLDAYGASGGSARNTDQGSPGGRVQTTLPVSPGQTMYVYVGGAGTNTTGGFNGGGAPGPTSAWDWITPIGGGGGASDIRAGGTGLENRLVVAGGGGGGGGLWYRPGWFGGPGGGLTAAAASYVGCPVGSPSPPAGGGSQSAGGRAGACVDSDFLGYGSAGSLGIGGNGARGSVRVGYDTGGGGGGGYYGGGGGGSEGGGGGGSSYSVGTNTVHTPGVRSGNGLVVITVR